MKQKTLKYYTWDDVSSFIVEKTGIETSKVWKVWICHFDTAVRNDAWSSIDLTLSEYVPSSYDQETNDMINSISGALLKLRLTVGTDYITIGYSW
jgi:hypothetical protein